MNDIFDFIAIKKLEKDTLLRDLIGSLSLKGAPGGNLYVSILPPIDNLYLIEFADYIPVTRYRDVNAVDYIEPIYRTFNKVFFLYKNDQTLHSQYKKYIKGKLEKEQKGENALEKGLRFDLILEFTDVLIHVHKIWSNDYEEGDLRPEVYQLVKDNEALQQPVSVNYTDFYGNNLS